jgi:ParB family chromosome partitioning protein
MNKQNDKPHKALGKGLAALLPPRPAPAPLPSAPPPRPAPELTNTVRSLPVDEIRPNPVQPRSSFDPDRLQELAASIRANGVIQPLIVRSVDGKYELVAGERRLRAAKAAGLTHVPALIQELTEDRLLEVALIENIQREDLNPIETAPAFDRLVHEHGLSHEEIGRRTGKDRTTVTNMLRLLKLPADVQLLLAERRLSMGHARALLGLQNDDQIVELANRAAAQGHSVRQVERTVTQLTTEREEPEPKRQDPNVKAAVAQLEETLGTRVRIVEKTDQKGRIEIDYYSQDDLDRIYSLIVGDRKDG